MIALRFIWLIVSFLVVELCVFMPLYLVGLAAFPIAYRHADKIYRDSNINTGYLVLTFKNPILNEWLGNHEDGILADWWVRERGGTAYGWFLRNPICNMRFWPIVSTLPSPHTNWVGSLDHKPYMPERGWFFAWAGLYSGVYWCGKKWGVWMGWKINPIDRHIGTPSAPHKDYRYYGLGLAAQIWRNK